MKKCLAALASFIWLLALASSAQAAPVMRVLPDAAQINWSVPGLTQWYRADQGKAFATGVTTWKDISGQGMNLTQATGSAQPTANASDANFNGQQSLTFTGSSSQKMNTGALTIAQPDTIYVVVRMTSVASNPGIFDDQTTRQFLYAGAAFWTANAGVTLTSTTAPSTTVTHCIATVFNGVVSSAIYVDSSTASVTSSAGTNSGTGGFIVGTQSTGYMTGQLAEVLVFTGAGGAHASGTVSTVMKALAVRYNQSWN